MSQTTTNETPGDVTPKLTTPAIPPLPEHVTDATFRVWWYGGKGWMENGLDYSRDSAVAIAAKRRVTGNTVCVVKVTRTITAL